MDQFLKSDIVRHFQELQKNFLQCFYGETINCDWVRNPFSCSTSPLTGKTMEKFIELSKDGNLKLLFTNQLPSKFWINIHNAYPTLARKALKKLLAFATTYLCETGFSHSVSAKTKHRSRLAKRICIFSCIADVPAQKILGGQ